MERALFALVANHALAPMSKLGCERWVAEEVVIPGLPRVPVHHLYRAMDFLLEAEEEVQREGFFATSSLLNLEVDLLFFDTTSTGAGRRAPHGAAVAEGPSDPPANASGDLCGSIWTGPAADGGHSKTNTVSSPCCGSPNPRVSSTSRPHHPSRRCRRYSGPFPKNRVFARWQALRHGDTFVRDPLWSSIGHP